MNTYPSYLEASLAKATIEIVKEAGFSYWPAEEIEEALLSLLALVYGCAETREELNDSLNKACEKLCEGSIGIYETFQFPLTQEVN